MDTAYDGRADFLRDLVREAGRTALGFFDTRPAGFTLKGPQDPVTEADAAVERLIRDAIARAYPQDGFLGEETGHAAGEAMWVVDPIDGTDNFARGIPHFCIAIAWVSGRCRLGAIYNPCTDELYFAAEGQGATKNGQPIAVSQTPHMGHAAVELGWSNRIPRARYLAAQNAMLDGGANVRRAGSGALGLAWVAEGRTDAYAELHMNAWDALAGLLLVREAGGVICDGADREPQLLHGGLVFASNAAIAAGFIQTVSPERAA